jgi:low affinity Fe/Cu permease
MNAMFSKVASRIAHAAGHPLVFAAALAFILGWALMGPALGFSENWQLVVNTSTTIVTFLMVFLLQNSQNRDTTALHAKLDELLRVSEGQDDFIGIEHLSADELERIRKACERAAAAKCRSGDQDGARDESQTVASIESMLTSQ